MFVRCLHHWQHFEWARRWESFICNLYYAKHESCDARFQVLCASAVHIFKAETWAKLLDSRAVQEFVTLVVYRYRFEWEAECKFDAMAWHQFQLVQLTWAVFNNSVLFVFNKYPKRLSELLNPLYIPKTRGGPKFHIIAIDIPSDCGSILESIEWATIIFSWARQFNDATVQRHWNMGQPNVSVGCDIWFWMPSTSEKTLAQQKASNGILQLHFVCYSQSWRD